LCLPRRETWQRPGLPAASGACAASTFFKAVRERNAALPRAERVRIIAGDAHIDWQNIEKPAELEPHLNRGKAMRETIAREVLDKNLKALAVFGTMHCMKHGMGFPGELALDYPGRFWTTERFFGEEGRRRGRELWALGDKPAYQVVRGTKEAERPAAGLFFLGRLPDTTPIGFGDRCVCVPWRRA
jgi:hypothetical protein